MNKILAIINQLRAAEPAWLADKRKPIAGAVTAGAVAFAARHGVDLTVLESEIVALTVGGIVSWAIPNKPKLAP